MILLCKLISQENAILLQFTLKVIGHMIMSLEPTGEEQEKFRSNFKIISSCFASLPFKIPGTAFYKGIKVQSVTDFCFDEFSEFLLIQPRFVIGT